MVYFMRSGLTTQGKNSRSLIPHVLQQCHNTCLQGTKGFTKLNSRVKQHFYWYRMGEDIKSHIMGCSQCTANRHSKRKPRAALMDYRVGYPLDRIAVDIVGPSLSLIVGITVYCL